jgi:hypothetical protein
LTLQQLEQAINPGDFPAAAGSTNGLSSSAAARAQLLALQKAFNALGEAKGALARHQSTHGTLALEVTTGPSENGNSAAAAAATSGGGKNSYRKRLRDAIRLGMNQRR